MKYVAIVVVIWLFTYAIYTFAKPVTEYSKDGVFFRIYNPDDRAYYCIIELTGEYPFEKIVYPGQYTRWYSMRGGYSWDCST